jgi:F-type H+-transporting ATPase subunit delta
VIASSVARRYARALLALGVEDGRFEAYATQLEQVREVFAGSSDLRELWQNPAHPRERRLAALETIVARLEVSPLVANLLRLLVERRRIAEIEAVALAYRAFVDERVGRVRAVVTSAAGLNPDQTERLGAALAAMTQKQIVLETRVDPALIGGVVAQVGSTLLDGSLRTQLGTLREKLATAPLPATR